jgi:hypothetical protein
VVDKGPRTYLLHVNSYDTNGVNQQPVRFYWNDNQGWTDTTTIDSASYQFRLADINHATRFTIGAKDDDSLLTQKDFWVIADSAPPAPSATFMEPGNAQVQIKFKNLDVIDDSLTNFAIVLGSSANNLSDTLVNFTQAKASTFVKASGWFTYTFDPSATKGYTTDFYFMVIARDSRGSISRSNGGLGMLVSYPY